MPVFQKGQTLALAGLKREKFPLPECGKDIYVCLRSLSAKEVTELLVDKQARDVDILAVCIVDDEGKPIFDNGDDVLAGLDVAASSLVKLVDRVVELSGLNRDRSKN